ncbi:MAG TPA: ATP-binding cassette domain-containing protein [Nitrolancea sp.]|jgi:ABC-2 type transport system ATP-binding protein|nr:ATP-binding cassette domain-containing protein [Nitrolancea sp.]
MTHHDAVLTRGLSKSFQIKGEAVEAVRGIDLQVGEGEIFGFLGPNGAGKTTVLRMLTTLLSIDQGDAYVAGLDVRRQPDEVRRRIGYVSQVGGSDPPATGRENLLLQAQLYGASPAEAAKRTTNLIEIFELDAFADRVVQSYSGGQRRRLDVALGIVHRPEVLFLDEPTTGLDPQNRANLWDQLRELRAAGTTIFLTTHYLEEADALSDRLAIVDHGQIVATGSPEDLKRRLAGDVITLRPRIETSSVESLQRDLAAEPFVREARIEGERIRLYVDDGARALPMIFERLKAMGVALENVALSAPSLDDVFLDQTGRSLRDAGDVREEYAAR